MEHPLGDSKTVETTITPSGVRELSEPAASPSQPPAPQNGRMRLEAVFRSMSYDIHTWKTLIIGLEKRFKTTEAAAKFVETLVAAGWGSASLRKAINHNSKHQAVGATHILRLQAVLTGTFVLERRTAIEILSSNGTLLNLSPDDLTARIKAALGEEWTPADVDNFLKKPKPLWKKDTAWLKATRIRYLKTRNIDLRKRPYFFSIELKNEQTRDRLTVERKSDQPPYDDPDEGGAAGETQSDRIESVPPNQSVAGELALAEFLKAGWKESDALLHLAAFPDLLKVSTKRLGISLCAFAELLGLRDSPFTELLWKNVRRIVIQMDRLRGGITESRPMHRGIENSKALTAELEDEARRIAAYCHAQLPRQGHPVRKTMHDIIAESSAALSGLGFGHKGAFPFLREHPELLYDHARPIGVVKGFTERFGVPAKLADIHMENEWERAVLFENPSTFSFLIRVNALRGISFPFEKIRLRREDIDFIQDWSRLYADPNNIVHRLTMILEKRTSARCEPDIIFRGSYNDFLRKLDKLS